MTKELTYDAEGSYEGKNIAVRVFDDMSYVIETDTAYLEEYGEPDSSLEDTINAAWDNAVSWVEENGGSE
jgi:hypothetical protein